MPDGDVQARRKKALEAFDSQERRVHQLEAEYEAASAETEKARKIDSAIYLALDDAKDELKQRRAALIQSLRDPREDPLRGV